MTTEITTVTEPNDFSNLLCRDALFSVRPGIETKIAIGSASCFLNMALGLLEEMCDKGEDGAYAVYHLVDSGKALIDSIDYLRVTKVEGGSNHD